LAFDITMKAALQHADSIYVNGVECEETKDYDSRGNRYEGFAVLVMADDEDLLVRLDQPLSVDEAGDALGFVTDTDEQGRPLEDEPEQRLFSFTVRRALREEDCCG
jgi:hypothetical protein